MQVKQLKSECLIPREVGNLYSSESAKRQLAHSIIAKMDLADLEKIFNINVGGEIAPYPDVVKVTASFTFTV